MFITTRLKHDNRVWVDRIHVSETELHHAKNRAGIIQTARLLSYARCVNKWRAYLINQTNHQP